MRSFGSMTSSAVDHGEKLACAFDSESQSGDRMPCAKASSLA